jgi:uncharacterized membrane protein
MRDSANPRQPSEVHRIDGRLHWVHHIRDEQGNIVTTVTGPLKVEFRLEDFAQLLAGACVLALPVALTEEVWKLGQTLSIWRTLAVLALSLATLAGFVWGLFYGRRFKEYRGHFFKRVLSAYMVTFLVALLILILFDKAPPDHLGVTLTRTIIVAFPSAFAATAVDFMK